jgi:hypothetical protein
MFNGPVRYSDESLGSLISLSCYSQDPNRKVPAYSRCFDARDSECQSGSAYANSVVSILQRRANAGTRQERSEAIGWLMNEVNDAVAGTTTTNNQTAAATLVLVADPDHSICGLAARNSPPKPDVVLRPRGR